MGFKRNDKKLKCICDHKKQRDYGKEQAYVCFLFCLKC